MDRKLLALMLKNLIVFKKLTEEPLICALITLLDCDEGNDAEVFSSVCGLAGELYVKGDDLTAAVFNLVCCDENDYVKSIYMGEKLPQNISDWANTELNALSQAAAMPSKEFAKMYNISYTFPQWRAERLDFIKLFHESAKCAAQRGYGVFAKYTVFSVSEAGKLIPVENPDTQRLSELYCYESERKSIILNTEALLSGLPANNVLLYGDAGTGKSSTVKAIANEYADRGLRLIQVEKSFLHYIPAILDSLASNPLKFVIYIDDLSFASADRDFTALKTILEGSVAARANNTVVYATSNRRHLLRESIEARKGDEVHLGDTLEESLSLSARFGIVVTFTRPDRDEYIMVVKSLARQFGLALPEEQLVAGAEAYAIRSGGRSPRVAKQYIEYKIAVK